MSIEYAEDKELQNMINGQIKTCDHFKNILDTGVLVLSLMKINMDTKGEHKPCKGCPVTTKRVGPVERYYLKDNAHFILLMDYTTWHESNDDQRSFWVHHGLKGIHAERRDDKSVAIGKNKPEISVYLDTISLYGAVFDPLLNLRDALGRGRKVLAAVSNLEKKTAAAPPQDAEVVEPEHDLPPPRRPQKMRTEGQ